MESILNILEEKDVDCKLILQQNKQHDVSTLVAEDVDQSKQKARESQQRILQQFQAQQKVPLNSFYV